MRHLFTITIVLSLGTWVQCFSTSTNKGEQPTAFKLDKKSTATDVLRELNNNCKLAQYVASKGIAVVTGGNAGIGSETVKALSIAGMRVVLCSRSSEAGEKVLQSLPEWCRPNVRVQTLDLADLNSVKTAAQDILNKEGEIDILLNNAGVMALPKREETVQGFELQFGTNHVGHHYLTRLLLPCLRQGGRVVTVASTAHTMSQLDLGDLNYIGDRKYTPWGAYGQSKLANILFAKELDDRLRKEDISRTGDVRSVSLHPGVIGTNLWQYSSPSIIRGLLTKIVSDKTIEQGAATSVYASIVEPSMLTGGDYLSDCKPAEPNANAQDSILRVKLWEETEDMLSNAGFELEPKLL